ncbi:MAG: NADH-quinone oxidoreductase subunit I [SAR202 cluster bacterium]|nr:NADH-quinone oxidoreductase subunit I [SAR202 cluster bacterium]
MYGSGMMKGFGVTIRNLFRKPVTVQYPEEKVRQSSRFRGQEFSWFEDRCTGCASCAKYCPLGIIRIVTSPSDRHKQDGADFNIDVFDIDQARCMYCGLCVEACPYDALHMGTNFEGAQLRRQDLVITVDVLRKRAKHPSTWYRPQLERQDFDPYKQEADMQTVAREPYYWHPKRPAMLPESARKEATADGEYK